MMEFLNDPITPRHVLAAIAGVIGGRIVFAVFLAFWRNS